MCQAVFEPFTCINSFIFPTPYKGHALLPPKCINEELRHREVEDVAQITGKKEWD